MDINIIIYTLIFLTSLYVGKADPDDALILELKEKGRLEVRYKGNWGSICYSPSFDDKAAKVACQQMGFRSGTFYGTKKLENDSKVVLQNVICTGQEDGFSQCKLTAADTSSTCGLAVVVDCESDPALDGLFEARLIGNAKQANKEILQAAKRDISKGTITGAVCHISGTAPTIAGIVCKQMGYPGVENQTAASASSYSSFFTATCKGTEQTLAACTLTHGISCSSNNVVDIECKLDMATQTTLDVRLSQSSQAMADTNIGTVEVKRYRKWGVICDTGWDINEANVVCRQLGFSGAVPTTGFPTKAKFGQGTGMVVWNSMQCRGDEPSIAVCKHDEVFGTSACNSVNASGVMCSSEKLPTFDICSDKTITIPAGVSFLRSPGYPNRFHYEVGTTCSCTFTNLNAATTLTLYIHQKMFQQNHVESLTFYNGSSEIRLYGDDSSAGPFHFTGTENFTIKFESDRSAGEGMLNIQIKAKVSSTTKAQTTVTAGSYGTTSWPTLPTTESTNKTGMIVGIVIGVIGVITFVVVVIIVLWKKGKIPHKRKRVGSIDKGIDESKQEQQGGFDNHTFQGEGYETKENDLDKSDGGRTGYYNIQQVGKPGRALEAQPKSKPDSESKEPETGETKRNGGTGRPASGSDVKVVIENPAYSPYELEEQPQSSGSPYEFEGPAKDGVKPWVVESSATADNANAQYAVVNKVKRGQKGSATVTPNETTNPGAEPPPYIYANNLKQDIDNGNINDDFVQPADDYEEVRKPQTFVPGPSAAYADIELGAGGAPSIQEQGSPVPENKLKKDKKKKKREKEKDKEGDKKEAKKGEKKRRKKGDNTENKNEENEADQKKDRKKSKRKDKKDKTNGKKNAGSSDDISGPIPEGGSYADPMSGDFSTYAEVGKETGRIGPVSGSQQDEFENVYDVFNRKGPNYRPGAPDPTYGVVQG